MCNILGAHEEIANSKRYEHKDFLNTCGGTRIGPIRSFKPYLRKRECSNSNKCGTHYSQTV